MCTCVCVCVCVQFTQSKLTQSLSIVASNNHDSDRYYRSALHYTRMHTHISVSNSLPTLSIVCSHFPSSSYYHYIITVIKVQQLLFSKYTLFMVMISVDLWVCVIVQQLPILQTQSTIIEHLIPSLLSIITSLSNRMCNCVTVHWSFTCICIHVLTHITHTYTHV